MEPNDKTPGGTVRTVSRTSAFAGKVYHSKRTLVHRFHNAKLPHLFRQMSRSLVFTSSRMYGFLLLIFGLGTLLSHLAAYYIATEEIDVLASLIVGGVCSLLAVPLLISGAPLCVVTQRDPISNFVLYGFFSLRRHHPDGSARPIPVWTAIPIGILLTLLGYFTDSVYVLAGLLAFTVFLLSFSAPELPFLASLLLLPYFPILPMPELFLCLLVGLSMLSYVRKVFLGNRLYRFERYDALLIPAVLFILVLGAADRSEGAFRTAVMYSVLFCAVPLSANLVSNRRLCDSVLGAVAVSVFPAALFAVVSFFTQNGTVDATLLLSFFDRRSAFPGLTGGASSFFLLCSALISVNGLSDRTKHRASRILYAVFLTVDLLALLLVGTFGALLSLVVGFSVLFALKGARRPGLLLVLILLVPAVLVLLPYDWKMTVIGYLPFDTSLLAGRFATERTLCEMILDRPYAGMGFGSGVFAALFPAYAPSLPVPDPTVNGYLNLALTVGVVPVVLFVLILFFRARHLSLMLPVTSRQPSSRSVVLLCAVLLSFLFANFFTDMFSSAVTFYLFWAIFGIGSATLALSRSEWDTLHDKNREESGSDSAYLDVEIR